MLNLLAFAASLRKESFNKKLLTLAVADAEAAGATVEVLDFADIVAPNYDQDTMDASGVPAPIAMLCAKIESCDGLLIASPEYNFSLPGTIKNVIDWVSRVRPVPLKGKTAMLLSASTGQVGGIRGLWQLRIPLEGLSVHVVPDMYTLPWGAKMFDENGALVEPERAERLKGMVGEFVRVAELLRRK